MRIQNDLKIHIKGMKILLKLLLEQETIINYSQKSRPLLKSSLVLQWCMDWKKDLQVTRNAYLHASKENRLNKQEKGRLDWFHGIKEVSLALQDRIKTSWTNAAFRFSWNQRWNRKSNRVFEVVTGVLAQRIAISHLVDVFYSSIFKQEL